MSAYNRFMPSKILCLDMTQYHFFRGIKQQGKEKSLEENLFHYDPLRVIHSESIFSCLQLQS